MEKKILVEKKITRFQAVFGELSGKKEGLVGKGVYTMGPKKKILEKALTCQKKKKKPSPKSLSPVINCRGYRDTKVRKQIGNLFCTLH